MRPLYLPDKLLYSVEYYAQIDAEEYLFWEARFYWDPLDWKEHNA